jgi:hypothetical protein
MLSHCARNSLDAISLPAWQHNVGRFLMDKDWLEQCCFAPAQAN